MTLGRQLRPQRQKSTRRKWSTERPSPQCIVSEDNRAQRARSKELLAKSKEQHVTIGLRIGDILAEEDVTVTEGITITLSLATFGAVESEMSESDFLDICKTSFKSAVKAVERMITAREFEKREN